MKKLIMLIAGALLLMGGAVGCEVEFEDEDLYGVCYDEECDESLATEQLELRIEDGDGTRESTTLYDPELNSVVPESSAATQSDPYMYDEEKYYGPFGHGDPQPW